ncbi:MAG: STAS domain-containing protein [Phycisphaerales bacterium]|nr:MAG: STAS domain-containing protein [Phycisphaerales bacterium]
MDLKLKIRHGKAGVVTLLPAGPISNETSSALERQISGLLGEPIRMLVLDLGGVKFISSRGVGAIAKAKAELKKAGADLAITNAQPQVKKVFEIMSLLPSLNVFGDTEELDEYLAKVQRRITEEEE